MVPQQQKEHAVKQEQTCNEPQERPHLLSVVPPYHHGSEQKSAHGHSDDGEEFQYVLYSV
jgi:hypothetical protein